MTQTWKRSKKKPQTTQTTQPTQTEPDLIRDEHALVGLAMAPLRASQRAYRHLSSVKGFGIVATIMTCYCAALSIETVFIAVPGALQPGEYTEQVKRSKRFVPKPYVNDGAELGRLNPLPNLQRAVLQRYFTWLPYWVRGRVESSYWTVWSEPAVLALAVIIAATIQRFEGLIFRTKPVGQTLAEFNQANSIKAVKADPKALAVAQVKAKQHNMQGTGSVVGTFFAVLVLYGLEIGAFVGSFAGSGAWAINLVYGFLTIAGFEIFEKLSDDIRSDRK
ncbi:MAG: hypothetical protein AAF152_02425 [Cyanobacteria bacterium P01_A01_bin.114]